MNKKMNNIKEAEYYGNFNEVGEKIVKWRKAKPENKDLNTLYFAWQEVGFYVHNLITNERLYEQTISEYRADKDRAVIRARKADEKIQELKKELDKYKTLYG
jgi:hypothetical protein